jgi:hypothetical protein
VNEKIISLDDFLLLLKCIKPYKDGRCIELYPCGELLKDGDLANPVSVLWGDSNGEWFRTEAAQHASH